MELFPCIDDLLHDLSELIDFDRKNAAIRTAISKFRDRALKGTVDRFDSVPKEILKSQNERKTKAARARFAYDFENINRAAIVLQRAHLDVAVTVNGEVVATPTIDVVSGNSGLNVPFVLHVALVARDKAQPSFSISVNNMQVGFGMIRLKVIHGPPGSLFAPRRGSQLACFSPVDG